MLTLPDHLKAGLDLVFVGINPGLRSAQAGHYFATSRNRFWPAFNAARMTPETLGPETDARALEHGIGFTDVVKRATRRMSELRTPDFKEGAALLREKLLRCQPKVVCFNGLTGYRSFLRHTEGGLATARLGRQSQPIGRSTVFVLPSTSPANAAVPLQEITAAMLELKALIAEVKRSHGHG